MSAMAITRLAYNMFSQWKMASCKEHSSLQAAVHHPPDVRWNPLAVGIVKVNFNAVVASSGVAGAG